MNQNNISSHPETLRVGPTDRNKRRIHQLFNTSSKSFKHIIMIGSLLKHTETTPPPVRSFPSPQKAPPPQRLIAMPDITAIPAEYGRPVPTSTPRTSTWKGNEGLRSVVLAKSRRVLVCLSQRGSLVLFWVLKGLIKANGLERWCSYVFVCPTETNLLHTRTMSSAWEGAFARSLSGRFGHVRATKTKTNEGSGSEALLCTIATSRASERLQPSKRTNGP